MEKPISTGNIMKTFRTWIAIFGIFGSSGKRVGDFGALEEDFTR
jgi:hypothetical protein